MGLFYNSMKKLIEVSQPLRFFFFISFLLLLSHFGLSCVGGSLIGYTIGGTVSGLSGTVILQNNGGNNLSITANGTFTFSGEVGNGATYAVAILTQPSDYTCSVSNASGTVNGADVTTVSVLCSINQYDISPSAGANGSISPSTVQTVNSGGEVIFTATPDTSYQVNEWLLDGSSVQTGGNTYTLSNITAKHTVSVTFRVRLLAYVSSDPDNNEYYCTLNNDGSFNTCTTTPPGTQTWTPFDVSFANVSGTLYAYVANNSNSNIQQCGVESSSGALTDCVSADPSSPPGWAPVGITMATVGSSQYAYVPDNVSHKLFLCTLNSDGSFSTCADTPIGGSSWNPFAIAFATAGDGNLYAYVAGGFGGDIFQCAVNLVNGNLSACLTTSGSWTANGIAIEAVNGTQYAYIAGSGDGVSLCTLNNDGSYNTCSHTPSSGAPSWNPRAIDFATVQGVQHAYVADISGAIYVCSVANDGNLTSCVTTPATDAPAWQPRGITLEVFE